MIAAVAAVGFAAVTGGSQADPRKGARYVGETSQEERISFVVTRDGKQVRRLRVAMLFECRNGTLRSLRRGRFVQSTRFLHVHEDSTFSGRTRVRPGRNDQIRSGRFAINARFSRRGGSVRGNLTERIKLDDGLVCTSGDLRFSAAAVRR